MTPTEPAILFAAAESYAGERTIEIASRLNQRVKLLGEPIIGAARMEIERSFLAGALTVLRPDHSDQISALPAESLRRVYQEWFLRKG